MILHATKAILLWFILSDLRHIVDKDIAEHLGLSSILLMWFDSSFEIFFLSIYGGNVHGLLFWARCLNHSCHLSREPGTLPQLFWDIRVDQSVFIYTRWIAAVYFNLGDVSPLGSFELDLLCSGWIVLVARDTLHDEHDSPLILLHLDVSTVHPLRVPQLFQVVTRWFPQLLLLPYQWSLFQLEILFNVTVLLRSGFVI